MTNKQSLFVYEYLKDFNGTQAAIRAGYSPSSAAETASEILRYPHVQELINKGKKNRSAIVQIDAAWVLERHRQIDEMDAIDILDDDGNVLPIRQWPKIWRQYLNGFEVQEVARGGDAVAIIKKIKWPDKTKNLEMIGKHVDVAAYREQIKQSGTIEQITLSKEEFIEARKTMLADDDV